MASTILIISYRFIVHSNPNNMALSAFPRKSMKLENYFLIYCPSINTGQSRSNSIYLANTVSPARFSQILKIKGSSHKKEIKNFIFSKMAPTILIKFCEFIVHSKPSSMTLSAFSEKKNA